MVGGATQHGVFPAVGLPFIPPELREASGELDAGDVLNTLPLAELLRRAARRGGAARRAPGR